MALGYEILEIYGTIFGITVRSRNVFANIGAIMKTIVGGELKALSKNIETSRVSGVDRLVAHAVETPMLEVPDRTDCAVQSSPSAAESDTELQHVLSTLAPPALARACCARLSGTLGGCPL
ncbi:hypothetical protein EXIGLDRAFT_780393 [Exidia glandulosa HHB12029]|uniref:Uncharacterized protein n=1 Tax=Exidia glandulosa HHB12029 TaxID=1314781 RepID=A0A165BMA8_EXIGL|nr:hypothetical protein EXIGLDRAFT_780393 [Exidia glandulosa HHB12029]